MLIVSEALARCALAREESRGAHSRSIIPQVTMRYGASSIPLSLLKRGDGCRNATGYADAREFSKMFMEDK